MDDARRTHPSPRRLAFALVAGAAVLLALLAVAAHTAWPRIASQIVPLHAGAPLPGPPPAPPPLNAEATVLRVVAGDALDVESEGRRFRVRLIVAESPEAPGALEEGECGGAEALAAARTLVPPGTRVRLELGLAARGEWRGQALRYVRLPGGALLSTELARLGHARHTGPRSAGFDDRTNEAEIRAASLDAEGAGIGLWACPGNQRPTGNALRPQSDATRAPGPGRRPRLLAVR